MFVGFLLRGEFAVIVLDYRYGNGTGMQFPVAVGIARKFQVKCVSPILLSFIWI
jgi:hypothetical protein